MTSSSASFHLHWLPVFYRVQFKLLFLVYTAVHNQAPEYFKEFLQAKSSTAHRLRSCHQGLLMVPRTNDKTFGDRAFAHSGPLLQNKLPLEIQSSPNVTVFKSKFKTYLFELAYKLFLIFLLFIIITSIFYVNILTFLLLLINILGHSFFRIVSFYLRIV